MQLPRSCARELTEKRVPVSQGRKQDLVSTEPFSDTFGTKAQRKRPKLDIGSIEELASKVATHQAKVAADAVQAEKDQRLSEIRDVEGSIAPELLAAQEEEKQLSNVPQDYILSAGTSKRIWGELYKVRFLFLSPLSVPADRAATHRSLTLPT